MANWTFRRAEPNDAAALAACLDAAYAEYVGRIADLPPVSGNCDDEIASRQVWLAEIAGAIAGALVLSAEADFMQLANVAVHPTHRGTGLGRALIAHGEAEARAQGYREMRLTTHAAMPENIALYVRLGWAESGRQGNKVFMTKPL